MPRLYDQPFSSLGGPAMAASPLTTAVLAAIQGHEIPAALAATARLVEAFPDEPDARYLRVAALFEAWDIGWSAAKQRALEQGLDDLARVDPKHPAVDVTRAYVAGSAGRNVEAAGLFTRVLAREDLSPALRARVHALRGYHEVYRGGHAAALADLEQALRLSPASAEIFARLTEALLQAGRLQDALVRAQQAVALAPLDPRTLVGVSMVFKDLGRPAEGVPYAARACELARTGNVCAVYALTLHLAGRTTEALEAAKQAEALPEDLGGLYNLACYWAVAGHRVEALRYLRRALDLGYTFAFIERDPDLASLHGDPEFEAIVAEVKKRLRP